MLDFVVAPGCPPGSVAVSGGHHAAGGGRRHRIGAVSDSPALVDGYQVTTHWDTGIGSACIPGIEVVTGRVVTERNRITGGGVTAGMDLPSRSLNGLLALMLPPVCSC